MSKKNSKQKRRELVEGIVMRHRILSLMGAGLAESIQATTHRMFWHFIGWVPAGEKVEGGDNA